MEENRYQLAGWVAIAQAILFPLGFVIGIIQGIIGAAAFGHRGPMLGPADLLFLIFTGMSVYTLFMFRRLLNERYNYHKIDILITFAILWGIIYQIGSIVLRAWVLLLASIPELTLTVLYMVFLAVAMITGGIIDILIAVRLLQIRGTVSEPIRAFTYVTMASGLAAVSLVLTPIALLLVPVSYVILAVIFLKKEEVEFV